MSNEFNGDRLRDARILRAMTLAEVAERSDLTKQAISLYENGSTPELNNIVKLSEALDVPYEFFFTEKENNMRLESTYFRSLMTSNKKSRLSERKKMEYICRIYNSLEEYIEFPQLNLPKLDNLDKLENLNSFNEYLQLDFFEDIALQVRKWWKLGNGPISDFKYILESNGIIVTSINSSFDSIDAYSQKVEMDTGEKFIIAITTNQSQVRARFDMAHELGHRLLHPWTEDLETIEKDDFKNRERQANLFASALLLPKEEFLNDILYHPIKLDYILYLKRKWNVSMQAIIYRARQLDVISQNQYNYLMRQISLKGYRKKEPLDKKFQIDDSLINVSIEKLIKGFYVTPQQLLENFSNHGVRLYSKDISRLLCLDEEILKTNKLEGLLNININTRFS